jgi:hypothetical protein
MYEHWYIHLLEQDLYFTQERLNLDSEAMTYL